MAGEALAGCCILLVTVCVTFVVMFSLFTKKLDPNQYGIVQNTVTSTVQVEPVYRGGLHVMGPFKQFITFPATLQTMEFSRDWRAVGPPIIARTGADHSDQDSGGQPVNITCAFQFSFVREQVGKIYQDMGGLFQALARAKVLGATAISNTAQRFTPQDFWHERRTIAQVMLEALDTALLEGVHLKVHYFELLRVDFAQSFEESITGVQVAEQQKVVNKYEQKVREAAQGIGVLQAQTDATVVSIAANANAKAAEIVASARREAFHLKQNEKAKALARLQTKLGFDEGHLMRYAQIRSLESKKGGRVVVGMTGLGKLKKPQTCAAKKGSRVSESAPPSEGPKTEDRVSASEGPPVLTSKHTLEASVKAQSDGGVDDVAQTVTTTDKSTGDMVKVAAQSEEKDDERAQTVKSFEKGTTTRRVSFV